MYYSRYDFKNEKKTKINNKNGQLMMSNLIIFAPFVTFVTIVTFFQINSKKKWFLLPFQKSVYWLFLC